MGLAIKKTGLSHIVILCFDVHPQPSIPGGGDSAWGEGICKATDVADSDDRGVLDNAGWGGEGG